MSNIPAPRFPTVPPRYDPANEAQFRQTVERIIQEAVARIYTLIDEGVGGQVTVGKVAGSLEIRSTDISSGAAQQVTAGANDSGGVGFRVLRVPN